MRRICGIQELERSGQKGSWVANKPLKGGSELGIGLILERLGGCEGVSGLVLTGPGDDSSVQVVRVVQRGCSVVVLCKTEHARDRLKSGERY